MRRNPKQLALVVGLVAVLAVVGGWLGLVRPQHAQAQRLAAQVEQTRAEIATRRLLARRARNAVPIRVSDLFGLTRALPDAVDMPGVILELGRIASDTGISFESIAPKEPEAAAGFGRVPIAVSFEGSFYELSDFLFRLRNLVAVRDGRLDASGRLFSVSDLTFAEGSKGFPQVDALLTVDAYVFGGPAAPAGPGTPPPVEIGGEKGGMPVPAAPAGATALGAAR